MELIAIIRKAGSDLKVTKGQKGQLGVIGKRGMLEPDVCLPGMLGAQYQSGLLHYRIGYYVPG